MHYNQTNLTNHIFGKLTVVEQSESILQAGRKLTTWKCKCECGNFTIGKTIELNRGRKKCCGCTLYQNGRKLQPGQKFNRLTTVQYLAGKWQCKCDCGNLTIVSTNKLQTGHTKSCGCFAIEKALEKIPTMIIKNTKYEPKIASARWIWQNYYRDADETEKISFEQFYDISQQNCGYCGESPKIIYNAFKYTPASKHFFNIGDFIYNYIQRIDPKQGFQLENIMACCDPCQNRLAGKNITEASRDLVGESCGYLTVIEKLNTVSGQGIYYKCKCVCQKEIEMLSWDILKEKKLSCGCKSTINFDYQDYVGKKFHKIIVLKYIGDKKYQCYCECGNDDVILEREYLKNSIIGSCGCVRKQTHKGNIINTTLNIIYDNYTSQENDMLSFDKFKELIKQNCYYCGIEPLQIYYPKYKRKKISEDETIKLMAVKYNGLDRIDNNLAHTNDNCVPCCIICNRAKLNRTISDFINYISKFNSKINKEINIPNSYIIEHTNEMLLKNINIAYKTYYDEELTLEEFYYLSQQPCFYCGQEKLNCCNIYNTKTFRGQNKYLENQISEAAFYYNGLDRIDSNKSHIKDNMVPCCKYCNFAKSNLEINEFFQWIERIQKFQNKK